MTKSIQIRTPQGVFASATSAARAHGVNKCTILNRCDSDPTNYQRIAPQPEPVREDAEIRGYNWYRWLPEHQREAMYQAWCRQHRRDPEQDGVADDFIASLDHT
jgi:hypothetical protein